MSVVGPNFGTFLVLSSVIGIACIHERFILRNGVGTALAGIAIWSISGRLAYAFVAQLVRPSGPQVPAESPETCESVYKH